MPTSERPFYVHTAFLLRSLCVPCTTSDNQRDFEKQAVLNGDCSPTSLLPFGDHGDVSTSLLRSLSDLCLGDFTASVLSKFKTFSWSRRLWRCLCVSTASFERPSRLYSDHAASSLPSTAILAVSSRREDAVRSPCLCKRALRK